MSRPAEIVSWLVIERATLADLPRLPRHHFGAACHRRGWPSASRNHGRSLEDRQAGQVTTGAPMSHMSLSPAAKSVSRLAGGFP